MKNIFFFLLLIVSISKVHTQNDIDYIGNVYIYGIPVPYVEISYTNKLTYKNTTVTTNRFGEFFLDKATLDESSQIYLKPPFPFNSRKIPFTYRKLRETYHVDILFDTYGESEFRKNIKKILKKYRDDSKFKNGEEKYKDYVALQKYLKLQYLKKYPNGKGHKKYREHVQQNIYAFLLDIKNYKLNEAYLHIFKNGPDHEEIKSQTELMFVANATTKEALKKYIEENPKGSQTRTALIKYANLQNMIPSRALRNMRALKGLTNDQDMLAQIKKGVLPNYLSKSKTYLHFRALIYAFPNQIKSIENYYLANENLENKLKAYEKYLAIFRDIGSVLDERKAYIETAKKEFEFAQKENTIEAYETYQKKYKAGKHFDIANDSIQKLKSYAKREEASRMSLAETYINTLEPSEYQKKIDSLLTQTQKASIYKKVAKKQKNEFVTALHEKDLKRAEKLWADIDENIRRSGYAQYFNFIHSHRSGLQSLRIKEKQKQIKEKRTAFLKSVTYSLATNIYYNTKYVPETYKIEFEEHFNLFGDNTYEPVVRKNTNAYHARKEYVVVVKIKNTSKATHTFKIRTYAKVEQAFSVNAATGVNKLVAIFANGAREASAINDVFESKSKTIVLKPNETKTITLQGKCEGVKSAKVNVTPLEKK